MRTAFVSIPRYPCAVEVQRQPALANRPLIVGDAEQPKQVLDCSAPALMQGIRSGMSIRRALGLCPDAVVVPPDPVLYRSCWQTILAVVDTISPEVEDAEPGRAYLNVAGLQAHYRNDGELGQRICDSVQEASGLAASVGIAAGKFVAFTAAQTERVNVVPAGGEAAFLAPFDVAILPVSAEAIRRLMLLGLQTIGEVAVLSLAELQSQFGADGKCLWQLVNGIDETPLRPRPRTEALTASLSFEATIAGIDVLVAAAKQLLSRLRPALRGRAARQLTLQAELASSRGWERRLVLREAVSEEARLVYVLKAALTNFPPPQAVRSLTLCLEGLTGENGKQLRLGERARLDSQVDEAVRQLRARYGYSPIFHCLDVEPWSPIPENRQILVESDA